MRTRNATGCETYCGLRAFAIENVVNFGINLEMGKVFSRKKVEKYPVKVVHNSACKTKCKGATSIGIPFSNSGNKLF
jgi:hypothetical protein